MHKQNTFSGVQTPVRTTDYAPEHKQKICSCCILKQIKNLSLQKHKWISSLCCCLRYETAQFRSHFEKIWSWTIYMEWQWNAGKCMEMQRQTIYSKRGKKRSHYKVKKQQTNKNTTRNVSTATLGKFLRGGEEHTWTFPYTQIPSWLNQTATHQPKHSLCQGYSCCAGSIFSVSEATVQGPRQWPAEWPRPFCPLPDTSPLLPQSFPSTAPAPSGHCCPLEEEKQGYSE